MDSLGGVLRYMDLPDSGMGLRCLTYGVARGAGPCTSGIERLLHHGHGMMPLSRNCYPQSGWPAAGLHKVSYYANVFSTRATASSIESYTRFSSSSVMVNGRYIVMMLP